MKLRSKLAASFGLVALVTFCASLFAYWQSRRLGDALYEVGVVRLPSIQGLNMMSEGLAAVEGSHRVLQPVADQAARFAREQERQKAAWSRFDEGWRIYEPLPQTDEEARAWRAFTAAVRQWRAAQLAEMAAMEGAAARDSVRGGQDELSIRYKESTRLLEEVTTINFQIAEKAKAKSLSSFNDMTHLRRALIFSALAGLGTAAGIGFFMGRRISKPLVEIADAMRRVAKGDLSPNLSVQSSDEIGQMAASMNRFVDALRTSEASLRALGDNLPEGMVCQLIRRREGGRHFVHISAGVESLLGLSPKALMADAEIYFDKIIPEDRPVIAAAIDSSLASMKSFSVVLRMLRNDGECRFMSLRAAPRLLATGDILWDAMQIDVTEQRQSEEKLQALKNHLQNMIDSMPTALIGLDQGGIVTQWNRQAVALTRRAADQALGRQVESILPEFAAEIADLRGTARDTGSASLQNLAMDRDGQQHVFDLMIYPLMDEECEEVVLRIDEVTERSRMQELMVQTEKMMSLGGLAAGMAHEVNNPLGIISQAAQNVERRMSPGIPANSRVAAELGLDPELMQQYLVRRDIPVFIKDIREAVSRAAKIVANMLQFSRKSGSDRQSASLPELLDRTVDLAENDYDLRKQFDFKAIHILRNYEPGLPLVPVVVVEMQQVFLNLLKNAAQALAGRQNLSPPCITLTLKKEDRYAVVEVEDNGTGMDAKVLRRIFEPFFTTKAPGVGTGLGLSVSYTIVTQNHQGLISAHSSPGAGSRFTIKLPMLTPSHP